MRLLKTCVYILTLLLVFPYVVYLCVTQSVWRLQDSRSYSGRQLSGFFIGTFKLFKMSTFSYKVDPCPTPDPTQIFSKIGRAVQEKMADFVKAMKQNAKIFRFVSLFSKTIQQIWLKIDQRLGMGWLMPICSFLGPRTHIETFFIEIKIQTRMPRAFERAPT